MNYIGGRWPMEVVESIGQRYERGESAGHIASTMEGVTRNQIIGLMWRNGYKPRIDGPVLTLSSWSRERHIRHQLRRA